MKSRSLYLLLVVFFLGVAATVQAADNLATRGVVVTRDIVVPAGTLMTCTLDEPRFSSATVSVGDPFLCHPRAMQQFGQSVFPRGSYIVGHLEADKDPGHFVGKGYLKLAFDRIGLPDGDVPLAAKMIAVSGYNVDRNGKIIGHGHATRDTVEWMLPPLWPWKVLSLPARGPRPTLKGEAQVTLRVMDDLVISHAVRESILPPPSPGWRRFGEQPSSFTPTPVAPPTFTAMSYQPVASAGPVSAMIDVDNQAVSAIPAELTLESQPAQAILAKVTDSAAIPAQENAAPSPRIAWPANATLFALADGSVFPATEYWRDQNQLLYVSGANKGTVALRDIDWSVTTRLNSARNVRVLLRSAPAEN
ncbi:MAG TPA: hypothetical protein VHW72_10075 [Candidatus Angelobacter sp.]|jgi:hypothetical protein|nr:hypothetical protein [Candidatus Angelobacter sp.]